MHPLSLSRIFSKTHNVKEVAHAFGWVVNAAPLPLGNRACFISVASGDEKDENAEKDCAPNPR